ncbi:MAG TPA: SPOR domain-containing protein [Steroidobacteraceae bacterium]|nr:SPOR domain-containing protein [Steroidobacteraceae bacterium]
MKERLTGAIILVALFVFLVPELLTGPKSASAPQPAGSVSNSSEDPPLRSYTINLADDAHHAATGGSGPAMPQPSASGQTDAAQPSATFSPSSAAQTAQQASNSPSTPPIVTNAVTTTPGSATPSSVTPSPATPSPATSDKTTSGSRAASSAPSKATPSKAVAAAPAPAKSHGASAAPATGWGVQLGVFASRDNAEHLAKQVRSKGFRVSVSEITSSTRKLYRVRVGPAADRAAAEALQDKLKAAGGSSGTVVPYS